VRVNGCSAVQGNEELFGELFDQKTAVPLLLAVAARIW
jgi:hypothetical protein